MMRLIKKGADVRLKKFDKILFVCQSNTSVSPMAEAILQDKFRLEDILIESRGLVCLFPEPVNPKAEAILVSQGLSMKDHASIAFEKRDLDERTLILTLAEQYKTRLLEDYPQITNLYTLPEYIGSSEVIPDPYGGSLADYGNCFEVLKDMIDQLAAKIKEEDK